MNSLTQNIEFVSWVNSIKEKIKATQIKAAISVNYALIGIYWDLGKEISDKSSSSWGDSVVENLAIELKRAFPEQKGFSRSNLFAMKKFYEFYANEESTLEKIQQLVRQIPWGHNVLIITKSKDVNEAYFYLNNTLENGWSRSVLMNQIDSDLFKRAGKTINNFHATLDYSKSVEVGMILKDPYNFDFLQLKEKVDERSIEQQLVNNITQFLLELGKGFAFVGQQHHLNVEGKDYYLDLLFYHISLKCYVVIELKIGEFKPEYAGKLNFYLSVVDDTLKMDSDYPTIGLLLCKYKNRVEAEYALRGMTQPMGVAEYELKQIANNKIISELPSIEDLEAELSR